MPTAKPRVNVTMNQDDYDLLSAFAARQGVSRSEILVDLWQMAAPVMARVLKLLEEAERAKESVRDGIRQAAEEAELQMMPLAREALANLDLFEEAIRQAMREAGGVADGDGGERLPAATQAASAKSKPPYL